MRTTLPANKVNRVLVSVSALSQKLNLVSLPNSYTELITSNLIRVPGPVVGIVGILGVVSVNKIAPIVDIK